MTYGVTPRMIESFGDIVFELSLNVQVRAGDPVRGLDFAEIERQRESTGLSDAEIGRRIGLATEQVRFIRVVMERRRFRTDQYRKLFTLGSGRRYRAERYVDPVQRYEYSAEAMALREAISFDSAQVARFVREDMWRDETLGGWLAARAEERPDAIAVTGPEGAVGYGELDARVSRLAGALLELGIGKGDVVSVQLPNVTGFLVTLLAAARVGAVLSTIHMPYRGAEIETLLRHGRARAVVCLADRGDHPAAAEMVALRERLPDLETVVALGPAVPGAESFEDLVANGVPRTAPNPPVGSDPYLLLYTSGTSAQPKAVPLTHQNMLSNSRLSAPEYDIGPGDVVLSAAPFSHLFGLYAFHLALHAGARNLLLPAFSPPDLAATIESGGATFLFAAPAHLGACLGGGLFDAHPPATLRVTIVSGNAPPPELIRAFAEKCAPGRCVQLWGMTELQCGLFSRPGDPVDVAAGSAGRACPGNEVRVADADGSPKPVGEEGELQVRGSSLFPGYFENEEANRDAFTADGWFRSGDLARIDADGNVSLTGRIKDLINRGGVKFNPRDVEALIDLHPSVQQSAIVPMPDPALGEKACCFAVLAPGAELTLEALCAYLLERDIAKQKLPERLEVVDEMPLTPTRKIIKGRLAERLQ